METRKITPEQVQLSRERALSPENANVVCILIEKTKLLALCDTVETLRDAALETQPIRLAEIETQMQVSCQARAAASRVLNDTRQARKEGAAAECHKETAAALRRLADIAGGNDD